MASLNPAPEMADVPLVAGTKNGDLKTHYGIGLVVLAVIGVFAYDGIRTGIAASGAKDDATQFAYDAANFYHAHPDVNATYAQIVAEAKSHGDLVPAASFSVSSAGTVTLVVTRANSTLVLARLHKPWDVMTGQASSTWSP